MQHQSLYRRFRPQRFAEVVGQPHLTQALRNAVSENRVGHAYLLTGPRGTGKTSTARILAKALNCPHLGDDGEPCGTCESCEAVAAGTSMDLIELDAASNNSVNHIREVTTNAALASGGPRKVYLLDEVHMLSTAASNALLKTLEEPPSHVVFILATTDPQKVLQTIRSRAQQFDLSLVSAEELASHVRAVAEAAGTPVDDETVDYVTERSGGSVRDALSALDTVLAAGGIPQERADMGALVGALAEGDLAGALTSVAEATSAGVDARDLAERTARRLRDMFLIGAGVEPAELPLGEVEAARELSEKMGRRANVRALEVLGEALAQMPQSADRRLTLDAALVRLLAESVLGDSGLARAVASEPNAGAGGGAAGARGGGATAAAGSSVGGLSGPAAAREAMAKTKAPPELDPQRGRPRPAPSPGPTKPPAAPPPAPAQPPAAPAPAVPTEVPPATSVSPAATHDVSQLQAQWETRVVERLKPLAKGVFREAQVTRREGNVVSVRLSAGVPVAQARRRSNEVEAVLSDWLDQTIRIEIDESGESAQTSEPRAEATAQTPTDSAIEAPVEPAAEATVDSTEAVSDDQTDVAATDSGDPPEPADQDDRDGDPLTPEPQPGSVLSNDEKIEMLAKKFPGSKEIRLFSGDN